MTVNPSAYEAEAVFEEGRGLPYSQLGDWVNHSGVSDRAARVYWTLCEHLNVKRGDREVWPAQNVLAKVLGIKRAADVAPAIDELVVIGAVDIRPEYDAVGRQIRNRYVIHRSPASDYAGPRSLAEFYKLLRADDGRRYESWFEARRAEIKAGVARLKEERQAADRRMKERAATLALGGAGSRTLPSPAETQDSAAQVGVRDSSPRGAGFRTAGVRDPALEQDEEEQHELFSLRVPQQPQEPPAPPEKREIISGDANKVAAAWAAARGRRNSNAEAKVAKSAALLLEDGWAIPDLIALAEDMARTYPAGTDLIKHEQHWQPPQTAAPAQPCTSGCDPITFLITLPDGEMDPCPTCHPVGRRRAQRQGHAA